MQTKTHNPFVTKPLTGGRVNFKLIATIAAVLLLIIVGGVSAFSGTFVVVHTNTVTFTSHSTETAQPIITLTTVTTTGTVITETATIAYYVPAAMYYTYNDGSNFYRVSTPFTGTSNGATFTENTDANGSQVTGTATCPSTQYCDLGFYYDYGALSGLTANPITVSGTGFAINLWINPEGWTWNGNTWVDVGTTGAYGLGTTTGTATVGTGSSFYITSAASGSCLAGLTGNTLTVAQIQSDCPSATFALWVGVVGSAGGTSFVVNSVSQPYP